MTQTRDTGRFSEWLAVLKCTTVHTGDNVAVKKGLNRISSNNRISIMKLLFLQSGVGTLPYVDLRDTRYLSLGL